MCTRVDFTRMLHRYSSSEEFPYTENQLACALNLLCRYPEQLCKALEQVDNIKSEVAIYEQTSQQEKEKNLEIEKKQEDAFEEALTKLAQQYPDEDTDPIQSEKAEDAHQDDD